MSEATAVRTSTHGLGETVPIGEFVSCPLNPRKTFDEAKLRELADSIASVGVIEPVIVRERADKKLEIVAGERRWRAAKLAKLTALPCVVRTLTDVQALEIMAIENNQREDVHPLEEADGYVALMKADKAYTPAAIATKIGMSVRYVQQRLQLARLSAPVKTAFTENRITAGHADLISRLKLEDQPAALKACFHNVLWSDDREAGCISVRQLGHWIEENVRIDLAPEDPQTALFPDLAKVIAQPDEAAKILQVAGSYTPQASSSKLLKGALDKSAYKRVVGKKDKCTFQQRAVVIVGQGRGQIIEVCTAKTECKVHWKWEIDSAKREAAPKQRTTGTHASRSTGKERAEAAAKQERLKRHQAVLGIAVRTFEKQLPTKPTPALLNLLAAHLTCKPSWAAVAKEATFNLDYVDGEYQRAAALLKPFGIDCAAIEKRIGAKPAALKVVAKKKRPKLGKGKK